MSLYELPGSNSVVGAAVYLDNEMRRSMNRLSEPNPANSAALTPLSFMDRTATVYGDCVSIVYHSTTFTWSQTRRRCLQAASAICSLLGGGILSRRQVVSVLAPNVPAFYELQFAVPMSGAVLNSINTRLDPHAVSVILRHSHSRLVFVDRQLAPLLRRALSFFPPSSPKPILVLIHDPHDDSSTIAASDADDDDAFVDEYENLLRTKGDPDFVWVRPQSDWEPIVLNYTSGTTSSPKGVVHCHRGSFIMTVDSIIDWSLPKQPVYLWTLPMFHANAWTYTWATAAVGATNICLRRFDAPVIFASIRRHGVTHMCGAPVVLNMLCSSPSAEPLQSPVHVFTAGAPPPAPILHRAESLGFVISHGYGLTETGGLVVSCAWKKEWDELPGSERARLKSRQGVGTLGLAGLDVIDPVTGKSVRRDGKSLGEVVLRGGSLMLGYLKDPEGTAKCMGDDGWFRTGDVGVMHPDGYMEIKDRAKDVIISGGENISSVEVESVLYTHPAVNEAAVVARPDEYWGETPCAFLSLKEGVATREREREIIEFCRGRLPHYMVPKTVVFMEELPKTSTGKIQKFVLRDSAKAMGTSANKASRL
ncbi:2-methylpropanoate--CoA ligase CCL4-like protein [Drosera capensis]